MAKTFVLLHGAWHGGWCWERVADILRGRGHVVTTPTQTGLGERRHLLTADLGLDTFIADVTNHLIFEDLTDVVLVGHSFGSNGVSGAVEQLSERVAEVIYLDSTILGPGERLIDHMSPGALKERVEAIRTSPDGMSLPPPSPEVFGVLDPADKAWVAARLTPHPSSAMLSPLPIKAPPGSIRPTRYIACAEPRYHPTERVRGWADTYGWPVDEIQTGHDAMVTAPQALADLLDR